MFGPRHRGGNGGSGPAVVADGTDFDRRSRDRPAMRYEICHLASPLFDTLPSAEKPEIRPQENRKRGESS